jgi:BirA family biotin operon repressor/biotin-[acetyl-CoA-carboxylase] ligase
VDGLPDNAAVTSDEWRRAADPGRRIGSRVEHHATIASTNDRAWQLLADGQPDGLAVVADLQTAGRGRRGRAWSSPAGVNLMTSVALRPRLPAARAGLLGIAAALAVRDACRAIVPAARLLVKWPNDVVADDGRKVAGLLLETALDGERLSQAVIGMGINANWAAADMPAELRDRAVSLCELAGAEVPRVALLRALLDALDGEVAALERGESPLPRLEHSSALLGSEVSVDLGDSRVDGRVAGYTDDGFLRLDTPSGSRELAVGEVVSVRGSEVALAR